MFVAVLDISIVSVALPAIGRTFAATGTQLVWVVDAYTVTVATVLMVGGALADRTGPRPVFATGLVLFAAGSFACGFAPSLGMLLAARVLQAAGGGMLGPAAMTVIAVAFPEAAGRARAMGAYGAVSGLGLALGPVLGGLLVSAAGWRSVFFVTVPVALAAVAATLALVPASRAAHPRALDPVGQLLIAIGVGATVAAITLAGRPGPAAAVPGAAAAASVVGLLVWQRGRRDPALNLRLFRHRPFAAATGIALLGLGAFGAFLFASTVGLQDARGLSPLGTGLTLAPVGILAFLLGGVAGRLTAARGPRLPLTVSGAALVAGAVAMLVLPPAAPPIVVAAACLPFGVFLGLLNPPVSDTVVASVPATRAGAAAAIASTARQVGTAWGVAGAGLLLSAAGGAGLPASDAARPIWWLLASVGVAICVLARACGRPRRADAAPRRPSS